MKRRIGKESFTASGILVFCNGIAYATLTVVAIAFLFKQGNTPEQTIGHLLVGACTTLVTISASRYLADSVTKSQVRIILVGASLAFMLGGVLLSLSPLQGMGLVVPYFVTVLITEALCLNTVLWFCVLATLEHGQLLVAFDICFGVSVFALIVGVFNAKMLFIMILLLEGAFLFLFTRVAGRALQTVDFPSRSESKRIDRTIKFTQTKVPPLIVIGVFVGFSLAFSFLHIDDTSVIAFLMVVCLSLSGMLFGLIRFKLEYKLEDFFSRFAPIFFCIGVLVLPFTFGVLTLICLGYLLTFTFIQAFIAIDAILESARLFKISSIWLISTQYASVFIGFTLGLLFVAVINEYFTLFLADIIEALIVLFWSVFFSCFITQVKYPTNEMSLSDTDASGIQRHPRWSVVLNHIAAKYHLSPRESDVLTLLAKGYATPTIAKTLFISTATTRTHVARIYSKMSVHSKEELLDLLQSERMQQQMDNQNLSMK